MKIKKVIIGVTIGITAAILWSVVFINVLNSMAGIGIGICLGISFGISGSLIFSKKIKSKRSIVSILTKKYLIASRQVLVCGNDPAVFLTKAIDLPENSDPCHPYDLGFLTANIQNNRMV